MAGMRIRPAGPADVDAIVEVGHRTWPATYAFAGPAHIASGLATWWSAEAVARSLATTTVLVAEAGGEVVGTGNIDLRGPVPIIWKLYVLPSAQGGGVGSALMRELIGTAGGRPVRLEYTEGNGAAARFYAAHGFVEVDRESREGWPDRVWLERP